MDRYCLIVLGPKLSISVESFCRCEPDSSDELIGRRDFGFRAAITLQNSDLDMNMNLTTYCRIQVGR